METPTPHHDSLFLGRKDPENRGEYGLVRTATTEDYDDGYDDGCYDDNDEPQKLQALELGDGSEGQDMVEQGGGWYRTMLTPLLPDNELHFWGVQLMDSVQGVRLFKFHLLTMVGLVGMFYFVRWMDFENDGSYTIPDMILYDGQPILMDTMFFFVVGRLYRQRGVDHLAWILVATASGLFTSMETYFAFLQHSVTLYSMHCLWPWSLWVFVVAVIGLCGMILYLHLQTLMQRQELGMKIFELSLCVLLFLIPPMSSPYFHFHHWYAGWLIGMHCNLDTWWSRLTQAWCWGAYINGIAVYGRDPLLTCGYSFYLSYSSHCPYLKCYIDAMRNHTQTTYKLMEPQDWRNCSADDYLP